MSQINRGKSSFNMYAWEIYMSMDISKTVKQNQVYMPFGTKGKEDRGLGLQREVKQFTRK